jgi:hypothetical protein
LKITIFNGKIHYKWSFSIATLNYQRVSNIAGTQVLDGSWQSFKTFLPTHMYIKRKEKGHSKMHLNVPRIYMWACRQSLQYPTPKDFVEKLEELL